MSPRSNAIIERYWPILVTLVAVGIAWGTLTAGLDAKVNVTDYLKDKARNDSIAGQTLTSVQRIERYLCRQSPHACQ